MIQQYNALVPLISTPLWCSVGKNPFMATHITKKIQFKRLFLEISFSEVHNLYAQLSTAYTYIVHTHKRMLKELIRLSAQSLKNVGVEIPIAMLILSLIHMHYVIIFNYTITQHIFHKTSAFLQAMNV